MAIQVIALVTVNDDEPQALAAYIAATFPLMEKAGGKILRRFTVNEVVVGHKPAKSVMIIEYPSREAVDLVFESETYRNIIPIRDIAFLDYNVSIVSD
jgi:uncharacterized protein (DUF1330 family)